MRLGNGGRLGRGLDVGCGYGRLLTETLGERIQLLVGSIHVVIDRQIGQWPWRRRSEGSYLSLEALFTDSKQRRQAHVFRLKQISKRGKVVTVFFNVALVGVANSRLMGGTWTFRDGLELAWERKGTILQWALVAATVGVILRTLEERLGLIGRLIMRIIGIVWTLACYFVVPVLAFEDLTPIDAVKRSSKLFRDTWGEKVVGGFSLSLVSMVLMLPGFGLWLAAIFLGGIMGLLIGTVLMVLYFLLLSVFMSAVGGIFNAALYRYACFKQVPPAFSQELIASAWAPKS